jgi:guanylate kinase
MARLIIVSGASGAGKSFLLKIAEKFPLKIVPIKKLTTRKNRKNENPNETIDLKLNRSQEEVSNCDYTYPYIGNSYGFNKEDINKELNQNKSAIKKTYSRLL